MLADALQLMRTGDPGSARTEVHAPWGLRFRAITGATFHVVLEGGCWLLSESAEPLALGSGDVVFLRRGSAHALADDPATPLVDFAPRQGEVPSTIGQVRVDGPGPRAVLLCGAYRLGNARPHPLMRELPDVVHLPARSYRHRALHHLIELIGDELHEPQPGRDGIVPALVDAMLLYILRAWIGRRTAPGQSERGWAGALTDPAVGAALQDIHAAPARDWTVAELAARGGMSRSAFAHRFTTLVGEPPLTYLTWWRMTLAGRLLQESDAPLSAIAQRVGYTSEFAFAKAFKRQYGQAPGRYRRAPA